MMDRLPKPPEAPPEALLRAIAQDLAPVRPAPRPLHLVLRMVPLALLVSSLILLAIGPEGGWTEGEFAAASAAGFREASLGENILRTETAVITGLAAVHLYFQSFGQTEGAHPGHDSAARAGSTATRTPH